MADNEGKNNMRYILEDVWTPPISIGLEPSIAVSLNLMKNNHYCRHLPKIGLYQYNMGSRGPVS